MPAGLEGLGALALEPEALDQLLREAPATPLSEHGHLRADVHARLEVRLRASVAIDAHVAGTHADDATALDDELVAGEARKDVDSAGLGPFGQPLGDTVERDDVVALLLEVRRHHGNRELALRMEDPEAGVVADVLGREALAREVRHELGDRLRIHDRAREHVVADGGTLLDHEYARGLDRGLLARFGVAVPRLDASHQVDRRGEIRGAGSDVQDVDLHALAFDGLTHRGDLHAPGRWRRG